MIIRTTGRHCTVYANTFVLFLDYMGTPGDFFSCVRYNFKAYGFQTHSMDILGCIYIFNLVRNKICENIGRNPRWNETAGLYMDSNNFKAIHADSSLPCKI